MEYVCVFIWFVLLFGCLVVNIFIRQLLIAYSRHTHEKCKPNQANYKWRQWQYHQRTHTHKPIHINETETHKKAPIIIGNETKKTFLATFQNTIFIPSILLSSAENARQSSDELNIVYWLLYAQFFLTQLTYYAMAGYYVLKPLNIHFYRIIYPSSFVATFSNKQQWTQYKNNCGKKTQQHKPFTN